MDTDTVAIVVTQPFSFAHRGHQVEAFEPADAPRETTRECAELAIAEGWARAAVQTPAAPAPAPTPAPRRAVRQAPANKDAAAQRSPADPT